VKGIEFKSIKDKVQELGKKIVDTFLGFILQTNVEEPENEEVLVEYEDPPLPHGVGVRDILCYISLGERLLTYAQKVWKYWSGGYDEDLFTSEENAKILKTREMITEISLSPEKFAQSREKVDMFKGLTEYVQTRIAETANKPQIRKVFTELEMSMKGMKQVLDEVGGGNVRDTIRPVMLFIEGPTRCGKSYLSRLLQQMFYEKYLSKEVYSFPECVYRRINEEFFSGYGMQPIMEMDDFNSQTDTPASPNRCFDDVIRIAAEVPTPLPMAFIKGGIYSRVQFCVATYNVQQKIYSLVNSEAVESRKDLDMRVDIDEALAIEEGNKRYLARAENGDVTFNENIPVNLRIRYSVYYIKRCILSEHNHASYKLPEVLELFYALCEYRRNPIDVAKQGWNVKDIAKLCKDSVFNKCRLKSIGIFKKNAKARQGVNTLGTEKKGEKEEDEDTIHTGKHSISTVEAHGFKETVNFAYDRV
jgi:hypothetical protein